MAQNIIIPYNRKLKQYARYLRKNSTLPEVLLWRKIKKKTLGYEFHRQLPIDEFIVDFYCHELMLAIEIDGNSHDNKYDYDIFRQGKLERLGVRFIRFDDIEIKKDMNNVLWALEQKIREIENAHIPLTPFKGGTGRK